MAEDRRVRRIFRFATGENIAIESVDERTGLLRLEWVMTPQPETRDGLILRPFSPTPSLITKKMKKAWSDFDVTDLYREKAYKDGIVICTLSPHSRLYFLEHPDGSLQTYPVFAADKDVKFPKAKHKFGVAPTRYVATDYI